MFAASGGQPAAAGLVPGQPGMAMLPGMPPLMAAGGQQLAGLPRGLPPGLAARPGMPASSLAGGIRMMPAGAPAVSAAQMGLLGEYCGNLSSFRVFIDLTMLGK